jgi:hypothetical protein
MEPTGIMLTAEEIAKLERITSRGVRLKYSEPAEYLDAGRHELVKLVAVRGGRQVHFDLAVLDSATQEKYRSQGDSESKIADSEEQNSESPAAGTYGETTISPQEALIQNLPSAPITANPPQELQNARQHYQLTLDLYDDSLDADLAPLPECKRPLARARFRVIERAVNGHWQSLIGQQRYGIEIRELDHYVQVLAKDSGHGRPQGENENWASHEVALLNWAEIERRLRIEANDPTAQIRPLPPRTIWRYINWFRHGKLPSHCPLCAAPIPGPREDLQDCKCENGHDVKPLKKIEALQNLDRIDKGVLDLHPAHAEYLISLFCSGDRTVKSLRTSWVDDKGKPHSIAKSKLQFGRPRSAQECYERLKLEIELGGDLPTPAPSIYVVERFYREAVPPTLAEISRVGFDNWKLKNHVYIPFTRTGALVNDAWLCDFRATNVSSWVDLDGKLRRIYCCAIMDFASRAVIVCFDFSPSAMLFKSTLRLALLTWGIPKQIWMDNGKEFTCEEVIGAEMRTWQARFECDDDARGIFTSLEIEPHYCLKYNPDGKAALERFFQRFDEIERSLPGWCGEKPVPTKGCYGRPDRWKSEVKLHKVFCANELPETPLWACDQLIQFETRWLAAKYHLLTRLHGHGLLGRTPAQIQEAFKGVRQIPNPAQLDLLLWYRRRVTARGDKVCADYHKRTLVYRSDAFLALTGDREVELHCDPHNPQRAIALDPLGRVPPIVPTLCEPQERSQDSVSEEIERQAAIRKRWHGATLAASRLAPVRGPEEYLALIEQAAQQKATALAREQGTGNREQVELPVYAAAQKALCEAGARPRAATAEPVVTVDPRDLKDVEDMFRR